MGSRFSQDLARHACPWLDGGHAYDGGPRQRAQLEQCIYYTSMNREESRFS